MKAHSHTTRPQATEESDESGVSKKQPNKGDDHLAEAVEKRDSVKRNVPITPVDRAQTRKPTPSGLAHIRERAVRDKNCTFDNLYSHLTLDLLVASFHELKHKAAAGIDRVTWDAYRATLPGSIVDLHDRLHRGSYRAKPSRRSYLLKEDGSKRPLGVASLEDKKDSPVNGTSAPVFRLMSDS